MKKSMTFSELLDAARLLTSEGATVFFTFDCPACGGEVSIDQPNQLPDSAIHDGCRVIPRQTGGRWQVVKLQFDSHPTEPLN